MMKRLLPLLVATVGFGSVAFANQADSSAVSALDALVFHLPAAGHSELRIISPTVLELTFITAPAAGENAPPPPDFSPGDFTVRAGETSVPLARVGFKRRALYAPLRQRDLRVGNYVYLELAEPLPGERVSKVVVTSPRGSLWPANTVFSAATEKLRYGPAIHVNQEGYAPGLPKTAMIGYYLGSLGELRLPQSDFELVDARTGESVFRGTLLLRRDIGYAYSPRPYQSVWEANFSDFKTPGEYRLHVPGLGASLPFRIDDGALMNFVRTYALGLYHQRCGCANELPFTRFTHAACHTRPAEVPTPSSQFAKTWSFIGKDNNEKKTDHPARQLKDEASQLYPFVRRGKIDVSGGHHDAGDYSKYTMNSVMLIHTLIFAVDALPGVRELDNLGLPESGDRIGDLLQEAKWEADFLAKMQDEDGGFYFLVYPKTRRYETSVTPDRGDPQIVWPKNTAATAAAVAALAQCASSPEFKKHYPAEAKRYLEQAKRGWKFLLGAIAKHGLPGSYQKLTHYGDLFRHYDELAWAACELFLATGESEYREKLAVWYPDPSDGSTRHWGWWRAVGSYGNALRSYAFAARSGRLPAERLDAAYLAKCENELRRAGEDMLESSRQNAYGTSFPEETKRQKGGGWYFSNDQAFDLTVAYQLEPKPAYAEAVLANLNYEAGCNPVNVSFLTGLGDRRPREIVHQYAQGDRRVLPPSGIPIGNLQASFDHLSLYKNQLRDLSYPADDGKAPYPLYDRWGDTYNVTTEFVITNQARALASLAFWATKTEAGSAPWRAARAEIIARSPEGNADGTHAFQLKSGEVDLANARIVWEGRGAEPFIGEKFLFTPKHPGEQWVEAEAQLPDGRRVFAATTFEANPTVVYWVDGALPAGAEPLTVGGDTWDWMPSDSKPCPLAKRTGAQHRSTGSEPLHEHSFTKAANGLPIEEGDVLFAYIFLDPKNPPQAVMLSWNDGGSWEHRAYWGQDLFEYGKPNTPGRQRMGALPKAGEWIKLEVPARVVALEGKTVTGMSFSLHGGRAIWDAAGKAAKEAW